MLEKQNVNFGLEFTGTGYGYSNRLSAFMTKGSFFNRRLITASQRKSRIIKFKVFNR
jgi:hypothetical protein